MPISISDHFEETRASLVTLYQNSRVAGHATVLGSLREGFVRSVLEGHVGDAVSWSTGQIVTKAPDNHLSGQLDLVAHLGTSPQIFVQDYFLRLIPSECVQAVVEVKSDLTTGTMALNARATNVLKQALDSLVKVRCAGADCPMNAVNLPAGRRVPAFIVAFKSGAKPEKVVEKTTNYLANRGLTPADFWPTAIVVLSGPASSPTGYALLRDRWPTISNHGTPWAHPTVNAPVPLVTFSGGEALAAMVCQVVSATDSSVNLEDYVFA